MSASDEFAHEIARMVAEQIQQYVAGPELLTVERAAEKLDCSVEQVRRFLASGRIPSVKIDSRPRIHRKDLERFIIKHKQ